jgi:hypothetical protein
MAVSGVVWDSVASAPLANATVQFAGETNAAVSYTATTDSAGTYRVPALIPGRYLVGFFHEAVDGLGIDPPVLLAEIRPDTAARLDLGLPGPERLRETICGQAAADGSGALVGVVRDAETGQAVRDAKVVLTWNEFVVRENGIRNERRRVPARVRPNGSYTVCGLPIDAQIVANAEAPRRPGGLIELTLTRGQLARRDFALGDSASAAVVTLPDTAAEKEGRLAIPITVARGAARMAGTVRTKDGRPLQGARIVLWGSDATAETSESGTFNLSGLPSGTYSVEVRAIGFAPKRLPVDLSSRRPANLAVVLDDRINALAGVVVRGQRAKRAEDVNGFAERSKRGGFGRFITAADIERRSAIMVSDVLRTTPGLTVVPNGSFGYSVLGRGRCTPAVYVDGMQVFDGASELDNLVRPNEIAGIEVYTGVGGTPPQFSGAGSNGCGVVAVWTKR